jgi:hypothetical protein
MTGNIKLKLAVVGKLHASELKPEDSLSLTIIGRRGWRQITVVGLKKNLFIKLGLFKIKNVYHKKQY